ncbi:MAG: DUF1232 domain-containing protein, partial [Flavobacteriales bacterium]|nr:DUF1232 domain-containing protein [Flavobacteriales bacterium]MCB0785688.1 DUF1232 domain-containing protein [Flavobacteriales bacterium]
GGRGAFFAGSPDRHMTMKKLLIAFAGLLAFLYLVNPTMGVFEFLPDNLPLVGNVDEATATMVLLGVLRYFGWDLTNLFSERKALDLGRA